MAIHGTSSSSHKTGASQEPASVKHDVSQSENPRKQQGTKGASLSQDSVGSSSQDIWQQDDLRAAAARMAKQSYFQQMAHELSKEKGILEPASISRYLRRLVRNKRTAGNTNSESVNEPIFQLIDHIHDTNALPNDLRNFARLGKLLPACKAKAKLQDELLDKYDQAGLSAENTWLDEDSE
jgi:hypothetical protein